MRIHELFEDIEIADLGTVKVPLYRNPSASLVPVLLQNWRRARGVDHDDVIWIWNAHAASHAQVEDALLLPRHQCAEFMIQDGSPPTVLLSYRADRLQQSARLRDMMAEFPSWTFGEHLSSPSVDPAWTPYAVQRDPRHHSH